MYVKHAICCACASRSFIDAGNVAAMAAVLKQQGYIVTLVPDLCKVVMHAMGDGSKTEIEKLEAWAKGVIVACHPRAIRALWATVGIPLEEAQPTDIMVQHCINLRENTWEAVCAQRHVEPAYDEKDKAMYLDTLQGFSPETGTDAWFPVIDSERCINCGKCHDFCLFGVYALEEGRVRVKQPQQCKNNCPACARMCPSKALIFPKYEQSPINGGLTQEEPVLTLDSKALYAEALRQRIAQRKAGVSLLKNKKP